MSAPAAVSRTTSALRDAFVVGAIGIGIGIMAGMSASPVVGIILSAVLLPVGGYIAIATGMEARPRRRVFAGPVLAFVVGLLLGGTTGLLLRTRWLPPEPATLEETIAQWSRLTGLPDTVVARRIFDGLQFGAFDPRRAELIEARMDTTILATIREACREGKIVGESLRVGDSGITITKTDTSKYCAQFLESPDSAR